MADDLPFCIQCGIQQLTADSRFCYRCGQSILPATPRRGKVAPWLAPVLVSAVIIIVAGVLLVRGQLAGRAGTDPVIRTPAGAAADAGPTLAADQEPTAQAVPTPSSAIARALEAATPPPVPTPSAQPPFGTETSLPTPTPANLTPEPVKLTKLAWSPNGALLAVGSATGVYLYDTATWQEARFIALRGAAESMAFSFDGKLLGTESASQASGSGRPLEVWQTADGTLAYTLSDYGTLLAASPTEDLWAGFAGPGGLTGGVKLWRASDGRLVREMQIGAEDHAYSLAFSPDGQMIVAGMATTGIEVAQTASGRRITRLNWEQADTFSWMDLAFRPNTSTVVAVGWLIPDAVLVTWDANSGTVIRQLIGLNESKDSLVNGVSFAQTGDLFATSHRGKSDRQSGSAQLWRADGTRTLSWSLLGQPSDIAFGPDGTRLAVLTGPSFYLYNPTDGSVVRQVEPIWHPGLVPTPTPTPVFARLNLPADWKEYLSLGGSKEFHFKISIPPTWVQEAEGVSAFLVASSSADRLTPKRVQIHRGYCGSAQDELGSQPNLDFLKGMWASNSEMESVFVAGGKWPLLIPATYAEFDLTYNLQGPSIASAVAHRKTRLIVLDWRFQAGAWGCVTAWLEDELGDISEQDRLDFSRVVASIQSEDRDHPFPTATPTFTPTPNPAPPPALPLQILFDAKTSRSSGAGGHADVTIEIRDAFGEPVSDAEVTFDYGTWRTDLGLSVDGRYQTRYGRNSTGDQKVSVEVYWNQELIAKQDFVVSWQ